MDCQMVHTTFFCCKTIELEDFFYQRLNQHKKIYMLYSISIGCTLLENNRSNQIIIYKYIFNIDNTYTYNIKNNNNQMR